MNVRWIAVVCLLSAPLPGCAPDAITASDGAPADAERLVVRLADFQDRLLLTGQLEAVRSETILVPRTPAWQVPIRWLEEDGATVVEGQNVLELDNTQFTGDLEQKRLSADSTYNDWMRKKADVAGDLAEKEFLLEQRRIELAKARIEAEVPQDLRTRREHQEKQLDLVRAETEFAKAIQELSTSRKAAEAEIEEKRIAMDRTRDEIDVAEKAIAALILKAPRDGIFVVSVNRGEGRKFQVGDNVNIGLTVGQIPELSQMKVVARLSDVDDGRIAVGMPVRCVVDTYPGRSFSGRVTEITPIAQEERVQTLRRSFRVDIVLDESDPETLRPGMSVKAEILPPPLKERVLAPRAALDLSGSPARLLLAGGGAVEVRLGPCNALECVVEEGAEQGAALRAGG